MDEIQRSRRRAIISFWLLGLLNNSSFDIMIAAAESISSGGVALIYMAIVGPGLCLKISAPYWFDHVSYRVRVIAAAICMATAFGLVGLTETLDLQLLGVAMASAQSSVGEALMLALASRYTLDTSSGPGDGGNSLISESNYRKNDCERDEISEDENISNKASQPGAAILTAWSSGTGFAGVFGYGWMTVLRLWIGMSFRTTILLAWSLVVAWLGVFFYLLPAPQTLPGTSANSTKAKGDDVVEDLTVESPHSPKLIASETSINATVDLSSVPQDETWRESPYTLTSAHDNNTVEAHAENNTHNHAVGEDAIPVKLEMTFKKRLAFVASLWPFMVPFVVVFFAEYVMQSGVWSAIGFPPESSSAREEFYAYANWSYQLGVL